MVVTGQIWMSIGVWAGWGIGKQPLKALKLQFGRGFLNGRVVE